MESSGIVCLFLCVCLAGVLGQGGPSGPGGPSGGPGPVPRPGGGPAPPPGPSTGPGSRPPVSPPRAPPSIPAPRCYTNKALREVSSCQNDPLPSPDPTRGCGFLRGVWKIRRRISGACCTAPADICIGACSGFSVSYLDPDNWGKTIIETTNCLPTRRSLQTVTFTCDDGQKREQCVMMAEGCSCQRHKVDK